MKIRNLDLTDNAINAEHTALGLPPVEDDVSHPSDHPVLRIAVWAVGFMLIGVVAYLGSKLFNGQHEQSGLQLILSTVTGEAFWKAVLVGLIAQTVDGALGMAYGITSTSFLLATGSSPAVASASVHIAEVFTTGVSGISHVKLGNVNKSLFLRLLIPGILGASMGAWLVSSVDSAIIKPIVSGYLFLMGLYVISKVFKKITPRRETPKHVAKLGLFGGFVDAVGGGGWGPVVTTTLVGTGQDPRTTIGSVNLAEFFLTFTSAAVFAGLVEEGPWPTVAGLVVGGLFAAPFAAYLTRHLKTKTLLMLVGGVISGISLYNLYRALG
ncbi:sulfite exporter TauE/SafE family protein [Aquabacterium sp. UBA2148]|uniref:sulfite exporter TauE/SafE family protein n=1 Tax=Aquabacterium sp. UBA2148 TaxID=1946042 RepID=UPI002580F955|nr:sulfite exporter TauE/SafE family protein [Aquabacterium sp. UBA2148]